MKSKRSMIIVAIMVTLVGTPRIWQEFGNILASLQHKTQNKLMNMVVSSQVREGNEEELVAGTPMPEHLASSCPGSKSYQVADGRNSVNTTTPRKLRAQRRAAPGTDGSMAFAWRTRDNVGGRTESLPRPEESMAWAGENQLTMHTLASVPPDLLTDKSTVTEFVHVPQVNVIAPTFAIKGADLIKLKKTLEESKGVRQRVRYIFSKGTPALPAT